MITCRFELKKDKIPTIQIKNHGMHFLANEYIESCMKEEVCLVLTSIDLKLFLEQYDVYDLEYVAGWKFKSIQGLFKDYIDKWIKVKIEAGKAGNKGKRQIAKLQLNSLYGKFAKTMENQSKSPYIGEDGIIHYHLEDKEVVDGIYIPVGCFITAYAREKTIRTSQAIKSYSIEKYGQDMYIYSDTDSIHTTLPLEDLKKFCKIDDFELGAWAHEGFATRARFVRQKCYLEDLIGKYKFKRKSNDKKIKDFKSKCYDNLKWKYVTKLKITCAGMPQRCYGFVNWDEFKTGFTCGGKLTFKHVKGGVILSETDFTIKPEKQRKEY